MGLIRRLAKFFTLLDEGGLTLVAREMATSARLRLGSPDLRPAQPLPGNRAVLDQMFLLEALQQRQTIRGGVTSRKPGDPLTINWLVPMFAKGSGGHTTIFRMIHLLEQRGHRCHIVLCQAQESDGLASEIGMKIRQWFFPIQAETQHWRGELPHADISLATSWPTAYTLLRSTGGGLKGYFVQDLESMFYPAGSNSLLADLTYTFGFHHFTAGSWLQETLTARFGARADAFRLTMDPGTHPLHPPRIRDGKFRVLFYARPVTERRCFELGMLALADLAKRLPDQLEVRTVGWNLSDYALPLPVTDLGVLDHDALTQAYAEVDVVLVLSGTNCSLLPLEVAACQRVPVDFDLPGVRGTVENGTHALLVAPDPLALSQALEQLACHPDERDRMAASMAKAARELPSWDSVADHFAGLLEIAVSELPQKTAGGSI